jgi:hypothetical protein
MFQGLDTAFPREQLQIEEIAEGFPVNLKGIGRTGQPRLLTSSYYSKAVRIR